VELDLDECRCTPKVKDSIQKEFKTCLRLLDFNNAGPDLFRKWYIDGRIAFQNIIDKKNPATGLLKLIPLDIRKIRKMKNVITSQSESGVEVIDSVEEFFVYSESLGGITNQNSIGMNTASTDQEKAIKILPDSISYATSGLVNHTTGFTFSHLHKAIKPMNQLRMIEDSVVIYRLARAPERRVFNVNTRNLPAQKAEQYVNSVMQKFRSRLVYDSATGQMADDRKTYVSHGRFLVSHGLGRQRHDGHNPSRWCQSRRNSGRSILPETPLSILERSHFTVDKSRETRADRSGTGVRPDSS